MAGTLAKLMAKLGIDTTEFDKGLKGSERSATAFSKKIDTPFASALSKATGLGTAFVGGLAGGMIGSAITGVFSAITDNIRETVKGVAEIGDEAKKSGLGVEAFQEWSYVADQNRVSIDALTDGFKELSLRADEWIKTGGGSGSESFQRLGFTADDLAKRLKNPSELMLEIVRRLKSFDQAARIRIMDELFGGTGGEQFVQLIDQGAEGLQTTIARAHEVGAVLDSEMIAKAQEIDRKWADLTSRVSNFAKTVAVELADIPFDMVQTRIDELFPTTQSGREILGSDVYGTLKEIGGLSDFQVSTVAGLRDISSAAQDMAVQLAGAASTADMLGNDELWQVLATASTEMRTLSDQFAAGQITGEQFADGMDAVRQKAADALEQLDGIDKAQFAGIIASLGGLGTKLLDLISKAKTLKANLPGAAAAIEDTRGEAISEARSGSYDQSSPYAPTSSPKPKAAPAMISEGTGTTGTKKTKSGSSKKTAADMVDEIAQQTAALNAESQALLDAAGSGDIYGNTAEYAATKAKLLTAMQQEGIEITPELSAKIEGVAQAYGKAAEGASQARDKLEEMQAASERGKDALNNVFGSVLDGAASAKDAVASLLLEIAKIQFAQGSMSILGGTGSSFSTFLGSLIGANANGTDDWTGGLTRVNERGGEILNLPSGTQIIPHDVSNRLADSAGGSGGALDVRITAAFDESGNLYVKQVAQAASASAVSSYDAALPNRVQQISANPRRR